MRGTHALACGTCILLVIVYALCIIRTCKHSNITVEEDVREPSNTRGQLPDVNQLPNHSHDKLPNHPDDQLQNILGYQADQPSILPSGLPGYNQIEVDYEGPCDIQTVINSLYDPAIPLTLEVVNKLRGCLVYFFFRAPRSGSTSVKYVQNDTARRLGYEYLTKTRKFLHREGHLAQFLDEQEIRHERVLISSHRPVIDVITGIERPAVMTTLFRHPYEQVVSIFKMLKYGNTLVKGDHKGEIYSVCNMSFSEFITERGFHGPCINRGRMCLRYLYGDSRECFKDRVTCAQKGKKNMEQLFLVVGISENIPAFLFILETLLPQFMHGVLDTYTRMSGLYQLFSEDTVRPEPITAEAQEIMERVLAPDLDLYNFAKQRNYVAVKKILEYRSNPNLTDSSWIREDTLRIQT